MNLQLIGRSERTDHQFEFSNLEISNLETIVYINVKLSLTHWDSE